MRDPSIHVIATTIEGTRAALNAAAPLARTRRAGVVLLVPRARRVLVPPTPKRTNRELAQYHALVRHVDAPVRLRVCLCRSAIEATRYLVPHDAVVVIGGRARSWWPGPEQRVARRLRRAGRHVLFAQV